MILAVKCWRDMNHGVTDASGWEIIAFPWMILALYREGQRVVARESKAREHYSQSLSIQSRIKLADVLFSRGYLRFSSHVVCWIGYYQALQDKPAMLLGLTWSTQPSLCSRSTANQLDWLDLVGSIGWDFCNHKLLYDWYTRFSIL